MILDGTPREENQAHAHAAADGLPKEVETWLAEHHDDP